MSEKATLPTPSSAARVSPGCLSIFKGLFISKNAPDGRHLNESMNEKEQGLLSSSDASHAHPPAYDSLPQEMSERLLANANLAATQVAGVLLTELWEQDEFAKTVHEAIERVSTELRHVSLKLHENPELGYEEFKAHSLLTDYLERKGFEVQRHAFGLETAFVARSGNSERVTIGICSEYDALPGIGHACGHNLIAISGVATAIALKAVIERFDLQAEVKLFGTPAEETSGGKITMLDNGAFEGVDVCMMLHGANADVVYPAFLSLDTVEVEFFGKASHASASPWEGINALDAAVLAYTNIGLMRQQMKPTQRVHGIIKDGGKAANIIPDYTKSVYTVRAPKFAEVETLKARVEKIFKGAAASTGCTVQMKWGVPYKDILTNDPLAEKFEHYMNAQGLHYSSKAEQQSKLSGSTDMGNLSYAMPGIHPMFNILNLAGHDDLTMGLHTIKFAAAAATPLAHLATLRAAKGLAMAGVDCILDADLLREIKRRFQEDRRL